MTPHPNLPPSANNQRDSSRRIPLFSGEQGGKEYEFLLHTPSSKNWKKIGLQRRAGVIAPLFSLYSKQSIGIGELHDLKHLVTWCQRAGLSIIQLLPMNDTGWSFRPYDCDSGFALEPMYLSLDRLKDVPASKFKNEIAVLKKRFPAGTSRVPYGVKAAKLDLLWKIFETIEKMPVSLKRFSAKQKYWLEDYCCFKVLLEEHPQKNWEEWPAPFKEKQTEAVTQFLKQHRRRIDFYKWLQWQLFHQFREVKRYAKQKGVFIIGDLPFLSSRNSADVWSHQDYFKLDLSSGAPPDAYFAYGQRWGMPPCRWDRLAAHSYDYVKERLSYAEQFYDFLRLDHVVGLFRLWSIPVTEPLERGGLNGFFDPRDEQAWEGHGRKLLSVFLNSKMLCCAEDLGTVPECSYRVLKEFGIPGIDVQRWTRDLSQPSTFKPSSDYRPNSVAIISTHDMTTFKGWWEYEAGTVYEPMFQRQCEAVGVNFDSAKPLLFDLNRSAHERLRWRDDLSDIHILTDRLGRPEREIGNLISEYLLSYHEKQKFWSYLGLTGPFQEAYSTALLQAALQKAADSSSIFSVQLLQDWLGLGDLYTGDSWNHRINVPGSVNPNNWSLVAPVSLEEMQTLLVNRQIKKINQSSGRV